MSLWHSLPSCWVFLHIGSGICYFLSVLTLESFGAPDFVSFCSILNFQFKFFLQTTNSLCCDIIICKRFLLSLHSLVYHKVLSSLQLPFRTWFYDVISFLDLIMPLQVQNVNFFTCKESHIVSLVKSYSL